MNYLDQHINKWTLLLRLRWAHGRWHPQQQQVFSNGRKYTKQIASTQIPITIRIGIALKENMFISIFPRDRKVSLIYNVLHDVLEQHADSGDEATPIQQESSQLWKRKKTKIRIRELVLERTWSLQSSIDFANSTHRLIESIEKEND